MPTYNGEKYIKQQLESILIQLGENDEVIISDDRSTDQTIPIIESLNDKRIRIVVHPKIENKFGGSYKSLYYVYKNVENALVHATGDYIFLSDQDDIWLPNKIGRMMEEFDKGIECVLHNNQVVDNDMNVLMESQFNWSKPSKNVLKLFTKPFYQGASMAFTKRVKDLSIPFPNNYPVGHDLWIACCEWANGKKISFVEQPLLRYRRHANNVSFCTEKSTNSLYFKVSYRFNIVINYAKALSRNS